MILNFYVFKNTKKRQIIEFFPSFYGYVEPFKR